MYPGVYYGAWFVVVAALAFGLLPLVGNKIGQDHEIAGVGRNANHPKWRALLELDPEISEAAISIRAKYGPKYEAMLAEKYLALNDKQYLQAAVLKVASQAEQDMKLPENGQLGETKFERLGGQQYVIMSG